MKTHGKQKYVWRDITVCLSLHGPGWGGIKRLKKTGILYKKLVERYVSRNEWPGLFVRMLLIQSAVRSRVAE